MGIDYFFKQSSITITVAEVFVLYIKYTHMNIPNMNHISKPLETDDGNRVDHFNTLALDISWARGGDEAVLTSFQ